MKHQKSAPAKREEIALDISKYIGCAQGSFGSIEEIDAYVRDERDSWAKADSW